MPSLDGGDTQHLLALGKPHPAEATLDPQVREVAVRSVGRRQRIIGLSTIIGVFALALTAAFLAEGQVFHQGPAQIFGFLALLAALGSGILITSAGFSEHRDRPLRSANREVLLETVELRTEVRYVMGLVAPLAGRLSMLEDAIAKVPEYGRGVIDGMQMRADALNPDNERP